MASRTSSSTRSRRRLAERDDVRLSRRTDDGALQLPTTLGVKRSHATLQRGQYDRDVSAWRNAGEEARGWRAFFCAKLRWRAADQRWTVSDSRNSGAARLEWGRRRYKKSHTWQARLGGVRRAPPAGGASGVGIQSKHRCVDHVRGFSVGLAQS